MKNTAKKPLREADAKTIKEVASALASITTAAIQTCIVIANDHNVDEMSVIEHFGNGLSMAIEDPIFKGFMLPMTIEEMRKDGDLK